MRYMIYVLLFALTVVLFMAIVLLTIALDITKQALNKVEDLKGKYGKH